MVQLRSKLGPKLRSQLKAQLSAQVQALCLRLLPIIILAMGLSGCVEYQLGIQFDSQTHGVLVQTLHLDEGFVALNNEARQQWLQVFIEEANLFSGRATTLEDGSLQVSIDFNNGADLVQKFNRLFAEEGVIAQVPGAPPLLAHLDLSQQNWGVALCNHLHAEVDLRALNADRAIGEGGALDRWRTLNLGFYVDALAAETDYWSLEPGQMNRIDATFWVPSPIGIGALVIIVLCAGGYGLRSGLNRW